MPSMFFPLGVLVSTPLKLLMFNFSNLARVLLCRVASLLLKPMQVHAAPLFGGTREAAGIQIGVQASIPFFLDFDLELQ